MAGDTPYPKWLQEEEKIRPKPNIGLSDQPGITSQNVVRLGQATDPHVH
jgi:hypothetical protein